MPVLNRINRMLSFPMNSNSGVSGKYFLDSGSIYNFNDNGTITTINAPSNISFSSATKNGSYICAYGYSGGSYNQYIYQYNGDSITQTQDISAYLNNYNYSSKINDGNTYTINSISSPTFANTDQYIVFAISLKYASTPYLYKVYICVLELNNGKYEMSKVIDSNMGDQSISSKGVSLRGVSDDLSYFFVSIDTPSGSTYDSSLYMIYANSPNTYTAWEMDTERGTHITVGYPGGSSNWDEIPSFYLADNKYFITDVTSSDYIYVYKINDHSSITRTFTSDYCPLHTSISIKNIEYINNDYIAHYTYSYSSDSYDNYRNCIYRLQDSIYNYRYSSERENVNIGFYDYSVILIDDYSRKTYYQSSDGKSLYVKNNKYYLNGSENNVVTTGESEVSTMIYHINSDSYNDRISIGSYYGYDDNNGNYKFFNMAASVYGGPY